MIKKTLEFSTKIDTSAFDTAVADMKKKLQDIYRPADNAASQRATSTRLEGMGLGGNLSKPAMEAFRKSINQTKVEMDKFISEQAKGLENAAKLISKEENGLKQLRVAQQGLNKDTKEYVEIQKQIQNQERNLSNQREQLAGRYQALNQGIDTRQKLEDQGKRKIMGMEVGGMPGPMNILKGVAGGLALIASGSAIVNKIAALPIERNQALGNATKGLSGGALGDLASGNTVNMFAFSKERAQAMEMAKQRADTKMITDQMTNPEAMAGNALGAASNIPGLGRLKSVSDNFLSAYQAKWLEGMSNDFQVMEQANIEKNPLKKLAAGQLQANYMGDLQTQRMMGLGFGGFHGARGFQEQMNMGGFNQEMGVDRARQIQAAGGSTRSMRENSLLGLQAERGFDLTNSGSVLGKISAGAGGASETAQIFKKILEEAVINGLNKSESVEELRKWSEMTADVLSRTGITTGDSAKNLIQQMQAFMPTGTPTGQELAGVKSAYQQVQGASAQAGGRIGALQFAGAVQEGLGGLGARGIGSLMEMPIEQLNAENPQVQAEAAKAGLEPEQLVDKMLRIKQGALDQNVGFNPKNRELLRQKGITQDMRWEDLMALKVSDPQAFKAYIETQEAPTGGFTTNSSQERQALARSYRMGVAGAPQGTAEVTGQLENAPGAERARMEDSVVQSTGVAAQALLENFRNFKDAITPASNAMDPFIKKIILLTQVMANTPDVDKAAAGKYLSEQLGRINRGLSPEVAPTANKPRPGG